MTRPALSQAGAAELNAAGPRDGQRFLLLSSLVEDSTPPTTVVVNWTAELAEE